MAVTTAHHPQLLAPVCDFLLSLCLPLPWPHACIPTLPACVDFEQIAGTVYIYTCVYSSLHITYTSTQINHLTTQQTRPFPSWWGCMVSTPASFPLPVPLAVAGCRSIWTRGRCTVGVRVFEMLMGY